MSSDSEELRAKVESTIKNMPNVIVIDKACAERLLALKETNENLTSQVEQLQADNVANRLLIDELYSLNSTLQEKIDRYERKQ